MLRKFFLTLALLLLAPSAGADSRTDRLLIHAVVDGDAAGAGELIQDGADPGARDSDGIAALMLAAASGDSALVDVLLGAGAEVDATTEASGRTALSFAAEAGHVAVVDALLAAGAEKNHRGPAALGLAAIAPPLSLAAAAGHGEVARLLVARGADVKLRDGRGMGPMHHAALGGRIDTALLLRKAGALVDRPTRYGITPLMAAATSLEAWPLVAWLIAQGADPNRRIPAAGRVLMRGAPGMTALMLAVLDGAELNAYMLILGGAQVRQRRADGRTAGEISAERLERRDLPRGTREAAERLDEILRAPRLGRAVAMEVIADGLESRIRARERDSLAAVLRLGFDPNVAREAGPLLFAGIETGDVQMVELLLGHGAGANARSRRGVTALYHAIASDEPAIARRLIEKGANPSLRAAGMAEVPLHLAADKGDLDLLLALLEAGARPVATDAHQATPLHRAVRADQLAAAKLLRRFGADPGLTDEDDRTALDLAPDDRRAEFEAVLK